MSTARLRRVYLCFTRAREYQIGVGFATDRPPLPTKASVLAAALGEQ